MSMHYIYNVSKVHVADIGKYLLLWRMIIDQEIINRHSNIRQS